MQFFYLPKQFLLDQDFWFVVFGTEWFRN